MNLIPSLLPVFDELQQRFEGQLQRVDASQPDELHLHAPLELASALCSTLYRKSGGRLVSVFAEDGRAGGAGFYVYYLYAVDAAHGFVLVRVVVPAERPELISLTNAVHAVNWQEREIQDLFGLKLVGHPNPRRCVLHDDWPEVFPLRKDFDLQTQLPPFSGERHKFREVAGEGVFQVPVGPVHAGVIEPGHFLFSVAGEPVLYLQLRMFYVHKGTEKLFESLPITHGVRLAESISGDSAFAHATAFCHAIERAAGVAAPPRGRALRTLCLELERISNHVADIGAICTDVAFVTAQMHALRLKEQVLRWNEQLTGNRLLRGMACLGGVRFDFDSAQLDALAAFVDTLEQQFKDLVELIRSHSGTRDRLETTGVLAPAVARDLGIVGIAGRASGIDHDLRRDCPTDFYDQVQFTVPVFTEGDVQRRMVVRREELFQSLGIIRQVLAKMPGGAIATPVGDVPADRIALGYVEGWRGEIFHWVHTAPGNRLARCKIKDPSLQNWPALSEAILGNIIPDFPVVNKSFNLSYSGTDR
ncbi:NADH-quinone oxidoreductase subunit C [Opitutus terrae]|uniref:NADH dehydrogenase (Quinone) n=1 Tax=Opitutus terrae (strain DSM 11246 / JCM 15787 / PB90-1) TaxID=452637 RepID=B1ZSF2_OPITP|nr:NADH-quinone oxidoreductase subunit C [Opitutus terrae]ACB75746.1 NADH dehydrogenase (quinone) [Opitutus terrae PB90-1]